MPQFPSRKPIRRIAERKFSLQRLERIKTAGMQRSKNFQKETWGIFPKIFSSAERILRIKVPANSRFVFVGRGMRPVFETVRALNEISATCGRKDLKYYVTPSEFSELRKAKFLKPFEGLEAIIEQVRQELERKGIASRKKNHYFLVDESKTGFSVEILKRAIHAINPNARVDVLARQELGEGISFSDFWIAKPTEKTAGKPIAASRELRDEYLLFQKALQDYLLQKRAAGIKPLD